MYVGRRPILLVLCGSVIDVFPELDNPQGKSLQRKVKSQAQHVI